ncbi:emp24p/erv25p- protein [Dispira simplex]|nr:emp24p/erv25p- protein [Dispira simplex]
MKSSWVLTSCVVGVAFFLVNPVQSLHFYLQNKVPQCFVEDLPLHTTVSGHYTTKEWIEQEKRLIVNPSIGIQVSVDERPTNKRVVNQKADSEGKFTFTTAVQGQHYICLQSNSSNWFNPNTVQVQFDMTFGQVEGDDASVKKLDDLSQRANKINARTQTLLAELEQQRELESEFRTLSERVNSRVVWYILFQMVMLVLVCVWQVRSLKSFFEKKKLV